MDNKDNTQEKKKTGKKFLLGYSISLFLFAGLLVLLSYLSQVRVANESVKIKQALSDKTVMAESVQTQLEQVSKKYSDLESEITKLQENVSKLEADNKKLRETDFPALNARVQASEYMWKLVLAYDNGSKRECKKLIDALNKDNLKASLSPDALTEFEHIQKKIKG